jgi:hypothetical protein
MAKEVASVDESWRRMSLAEQMEAMRKGFSHYAEVVIMQRLGPGA